MIRCIALVITLAVLPQTSASQTDPVRLAEDLLTKLGYDVGPIDGVDDAALRSAVRRYQTDRNLLVSGGLTPQEFAVLQSEAMSARPVVSPATPQGPMAQVAPAIPTMAYHKIAHCPFIQGFGFVQYRSYGIASFRAEHTDLCWDPEGGNLYASFPITGVTLVSDAGGTKKYEDIASAVETGQRKGVTVSAFPSDRKSPVQNAPNTGQLAAGMGTTYQSQAGESVTIYGSLYEGLAAEPVAERRYFLAGISQVFADRGPTDLIHGSASARGTITVTSVGAKMSIEPDPQDAAGSGTGQIVLTRKDGIYTGQGHISMRNQRLAGHQPGEWVTAEFPISSLRGIMMDAEGQAGGFSYEGPAQITDVAGVTLQGWGSFSVVAMTAPAPF